MLGKVGKLSFNRCVLVECVVFCVRYLSVLCIYLWLDDDGNGSSLVVMFMVVVL